MLLYPFDEQFDIPAFSVELCDWMSALVVRNLAHGQSFRQRLMVLLSKVILRSVLGKTHKEELIIAGQIPGTIVTLVSCNACVEVSTRYKRHKLSQYGFSYVHRQTDQLVSPKLQFKLCTRKNCVINYK